MDRLGSSSTYSFGDLAASFLGLDNTLDDSDGNGLPHVTDGKTSKGWVVGESLHAHGLGRNHLDNGGIPRFDELGSVFDGFTGTTIDLLEELGEFAGNVGSVAIEHRSVTSTDLTGVVENDDLGVERVAALGGVILGVTSNVASPNLLDGNVLDVEANVVAGNTLDELLVVHLNRLDFSGDVGRSEGDDHAGFDDTGLDTADGHSPNTTDLVHILKGETEGLVGGTGGRVDAVNGFQQGLAGNLGLGLLLPSLVPWAVAGDVDHVVTVEAGDGDKWHVLGVVADLLDERGSLLDDLVVAILGPFGGVHLVNRDNDLSDTQGVGQESVLAGLTILGDTGFELTSTGSDNQDSAVGLGGTSDHVLDEVTMSRGIDDGDVVFWCLELP